MEGHKKLHKLIHVTGMDMQRGHHLHTDDIGTPQLYSQQVQTIAWLTWPRKQKQLPCFTIARI